MVLSPATAAAAELLQLPPEEVRRVRHIGIRGFQHRHALRSRSDDDHGSAVETIRHAKQRRVARVATYYLATVEPVFEECRFDIVAITAGEAILIKDAFRVK